MNNGKHSFYFEIFFAKYLLCVTCSWIYLMMSCMPWDWTISWSVLVSNAAEKKHICIRL